MFFRLYNSKINHLYKYRKKKQHIYYKRVGNIRLLLFEGIFNYILMYSYLKCHLNDLI